LDTIMQSAGSPTAIPTAMAGLGPAMWVASLRRP
jgi:hypothetical protein